MTMFSCSILLLRFKFDRPHDLKVIVIKRTKMGTEEQTTDEILRGNYSWNGLLVLDPNTYAVQVFENYRAA